MTKKVIVLSMLLLFQSTYAFSGETADKVADFMTWVVIILLPIGGIYLFWQAHIYPEKVAEKKHHPQLEAIKTMCLLSLFFGGLLWPVALIWANYNYGDKKAKKHKEEIEPTENQPIKIPVETNKTEEIKQF